MADIAAVYGWGPSAFEDMSLADLADERDRAVKRWRAMNGVKD